MDDSLNNASPSQGNTNPPQVSTDGKLIKRRSISTASQAQKIADSLVFADAGRDLRRAEVQRAINGAAPYSEKALREKNQGHRFNVSVGYLEGACGRAYTPYVDMGLDEEFVARIVADLDETKNNIIRSEFVAAVRRWGMWPVNYNGLVCETVDFGYCTAVFPDTESPWWHFVRQRDGLTFARAPNTTAKLDVYVWKRSYRIHELYDHISDEQAAKDAGWQIENCYQAMQDAVTDDYTRNRLMGGRQIFEEAIRAAAIYLSYGEGARVINTYHVFCAELSGKVSHWIVLDNSVSQKAPDEPESDKIQLFYRFEQFESMEELVTRFDLEYGDGFWHGSKGLAQKLYPVHKAHDRLICTGLDTTFRSGLNILKCNSQKATSAYNITVTSDNVVLGPDIDAIQGIKMPALTQEFFAMDAALLATATQRGGDVAPEAMGIDRPAKTATQSSIDQGQKQLITKSNMKRWVPQLSAVIDRMLRRLINPKSSHPDAIRFREAIMAKGITEEDIKKVYGAEVYHTIEDVFGETKQAVSYLADKYRADPDINRIDLKKKEFAIFLGPKASLELVPGDADQLEAMKASRLQTMELSAMLDGNGVPVAPDDLHPVHVQTIVNYLNDASQRLVSGQTSGRRSPTPQDIQNIAAHASEHVKAQASVKGQREIARNMDAMLQQALGQFAQAGVVHQQKHDEALQRGLLAGAIDAQTQPTTSPAPTQPPSSPLPQPSPEVMAA